VPDEWTLGGSGGLAVTLPTTAFHGKAAQIATPSGQVGYLDAPVRTLGFVPPASARLAATAAVSVDSTTTDAYLAVYTHNNVAGTGTPTSTLFISAMGHTEEPLVRYSTVAIPTSTRSVRARLVTHGGAARFDDVRVAVVY
jgi:hypothetical protein